MSDQQPLSGMPQRLTPATPTRLATWQQCPRRYRYTYLDRPRPPKGPPWAHNTVGAVAHLALASWWRLPVAERTPAAAAEAVNEAWPDAVAGPARGGFADDEHGTAWQARVSEMVARYTAPLDPDTEPRGVERTVSIVYGGVALSGRVDRIDERDGQLVVVDYKTGRATPDLHDAKSSQALAIYAAATWRTLRTPCTQVELHHLPSGEVAAWEHDEASVRRQLDRADAVASEIAAADAAFYEGSTGDETFPAQPSSLCGWCDFVEICPEGSQTASRRPSWSALPD